MISYLVHDNWETSIIKFVFEDSRKKEEKERKKKKKNCLVIFSSNIVSLLMILLVIFFILPATNWFCCSDITCFSFWSRRNFEHNMFSSVFFFSLKSLRKNKNKIKQRTSRYDVIRWLTPYILTYFLVESKMSIFCWRKVYRLNSNKECHPLKKKTCYLRKELRKTPRPIKKAHNQQNRPEVNCSMREAIE